MLTVEDKGQRPSQQVVRSDLGKMPLLLRLDALSSSRRRTNIPYACKLINASLHIETTDTVRPITTYQGRGCADPGTAKWQHAIVTTKNPPSLPTEDEQPEHGEYGMQATVFVTPASEGHSLNDMSRINFAKVYAVDHDVKVLRMGKVCADNVVMLLQQRDAVENNNVDAIVSSS